MQPIYGSESWPQSVGPQYVQQKTRSKSGLGNARNAVERVSLKWDQRKRHTRSAPSPLVALSDSHILEPQFECNAILDALEVFEASAHHEWTWLAIIAGPAAESGNYPSGKGE
jgi:hypothetical protein